MGRGGAVVGGLLGPALGAAGTAAGAGGAGSAVAAVGAAAVTAGCALSASKPRSPEAPDNAPTAPMMTPSASTKITPPFPQKAVHELTCSPAWVRIDLRSTNCDTPRRNQPTTRT